MSDYLIESIGRVDWQPPTTAPCLPTPGSTPLQIRDHTDQWHPDRQPTRADARRLCAGCPALNKCLTLNLHEKEGVWGGTTPDDRKRLRGDLPVECPQGHEMTVANTYVYPSGKHRCRACLAAMESSRVRNRSKKNAA